MPLEQGKGKQTFRDNVRELYAANEAKPEGKKRPRKQILAIAFAKRRESGGKG